MNGLLLTMFIFVIIIGICLLTFITLTRRGIHSNLDKDKYRSRWLAITQNAGSTSQSWQFAIVSADKLLDSALRDKRIAGETMGERLKNSTAHFSSIDSIWRAHKLRNRIAHEDNVEVSKRQANEALKAFKRALMDLGAL